jgi:hypothetical protein
MFPSLSDRTKSFLAVAAVLVVAVCNVVFGMDWVSEQGARRAAATAGAIDTPIVAAPPAAADGVPMNDTAAQMNAPAAPAAAAPPPKCDVTACTEAYRTFRASDCTYMPSAGVRRLCTKGKPPQ